MLKLLESGSEIEYADLSSELSGSMKIPLTTKYPPAERDSLHLTIPIDEIPFTLTDADALRPHGTEFRYKADVACKACQQILITARTLSAENRVKTLRLNYGLPQIRESASLGCHMCSIISLSTVDRVRNGRPSVYTSIADSEDTGYICVRIHSHEDEEQVFNMGVACGVGESIYKRHLRVFPIDTVETKSCKTLEDQPTPSLGCFTGDWETLDVAKAWLRTCLRDHNTCKETDQRGSRLGASRLLFVGVLGQSIQVVDNEIGEKTEYATLSHCWGNQSHIPRLTSKTETWMREGIELSSLPNTFRQAVQITRTLGYRYLWIDSLCILQDSTADWLEQGARMAQIYAQSVFTIAAIKSSDSSGGCFTEQRNPLGLRPLLLHDLRLRVEPVSSRHWDLEVNETGRDAMPLHQRAWVIQERLSSPRTIYWGSLGIYWECRCSLAAEWHVSDVSTDALDNTKMLLTNLKQTLSGTVVTSGSNVNSWEQSFLFIWNSFLALYTQCRLTYWTDRVPAMAGMISEVEQRTNMRCIFGLWDFSWALGLVWWTSDPNIDHRADAFYEKSKSSGRLENRMPSW